MKKIVQKDNKTLREIARKIAIKDIKTPKIKKIIKEMKEALASQEDGVALAAPQIGYSLRVFVISGKILAEDFIKKAKSGEAGSPDASQSEAFRDNMVFINPKITKLSRKKEWVDEGCLSVRWYYGKTHRHKQATIEARDEKGKKFIRGASGLLAQAFQHETDHLDGTLFIDHAKDLIDQPPKE